MRRIEDVPVDSFVWAYRTDVPEALHAVRDERFYDWRFENPRRTYDAYVAESDGVDAGLVVGTHEEDGVTVTEVTDVVPLAGEDREPAVTALLARAVVDHTGTDVFAAHPGALPDCALSTLGFLSDSSPPLSIAASPTNHMARPYDGTRSRFGGAIDPRSWCISFAERDTA